MLAELHSSLQHLLRERGVKAGLFRPQESRRRAGPRSGAAASGGCTGSGTPEILREGLANDRIRSEDEQPVYRVGDPMKLTILTTKASGTA